ncbi:MAG: FAD-dependent oxidoreductase [Candidatus Brocadiae bacterium]|nr:FAD-dependent oxidoreductase [Candidatus Brocadiia bacterium]
MPSSALVVGGGLAGIAAACDLADAGWRVTLLERRRRLGGMVASFPDPEGTVELDNGEHIAIEACRELYALFGRLGVGDRVRRQPRLSIPFLGPDGRRADLGESAWSFLSFRFLSFGDRWRVARGIGAIGRLKDAEIARLDNLTAREWLEDIGQSPEAIARFWEMFVCPALNEPCERASAALAARVLRDAMGRGPAESRFGLFTVPLGTFLGEAAARWLGERGGEGRTRECAVVAGSRGRAPDAPVGSARWIVRPPPRNARAPRRGGPGTGWRSRCGRRVGLGG